MKNPMKIRANNESETVQAAAKLAHELQPGDFVFLHGNLGAGKTVFARALVRALSGDESLEVPSPTFTLLQTYDSEKGPVNHYDLYRLKDPDEVFELGWEESVNGITIVEWPERLGSLAPAQRLDITLSNVKNKPDVREIEIIKRT